MGEATRRPWWHAFGRVRLLDPADEHSAVWQLVVVSPSTTPPEEVAATVGGAALDAWGDYLASWDHEPTDDEKEAVTPDEFRDDDACPDDGDELLVLAGDEARVDPAVVAAILQAAVAAAGGFGGLGKAGGYFDPLNP